MVWKHCIYELWLDFQENCIAFGPNLALLWLIEVIFYCVGNIDLFWREEGIKCQTKTLLPVGKFENSITVKGLE